MTVKPSMCHSYSGTEYFSVRLPVDFTRQFKEFREKILDVQFSGAQITYTVVK